MNAVFIEPIIVINYGKILLVRKRFVRHVCYENVNQFGLNYVK